MCSRCQNTVSFTSYYNIFIFTNKQLVQHSNTVLHEETGIQLYVKRCSSSMLFMLSLSDFHHGKGPVTVTVVISVVDEDQRCFFVPYLLLLGVPTGFMALLYFKKSLLEQTGTGSITTIGLIFLVL